MAIIINSSFAGKKRSQRGILGSGYERAKSSSYNRHELQETRQRGSLGSLLFSYYLCT